MKIIRAYKTELDPNDSQRVQLRRSAGAARWAWNQALAVNQRYYRETGVGLSYARMNKLLTTWKRHPMNAWTYEVSKCCFQSALQDLNRAFVNFFAGRAKYPRFKSRHERQSFRLYGTIYADERSVRLPKIGTVRAGEEVLTPLDSRGAKEYDGAVSADAHTKAVFSMYTIRFRPHGATRDRLVSSAEDEVPAPWGRFLYGGA